MIDRIDLILKSRNINASQFADEIDIPRSVLSHVLSGRNRPSLDFILKILKAYPEINPGWILLGEGTMLKEGVTSAGKASAAPEQAEKKKVKPEDSGDVTLTSAPSSPAPREVSDDSMQPEKIVLLFADSTFRIYTPSEPTDL
jgi:transcriptional regulator with XRE-family HTH domain